MWSRRLASLAARWWLLACALLVLAVPAAQAQSLESVLAPGKVIQGHAKWEDACKSCHVRFERNAQDGLCMDCHKDVAQDVRGKRGFHGRIPPQTCRSCHTDHKGRDARIVELDTRRFDHALTDYALRGKHAGTDCTQCHAPAKKYRDAASDCNACHRKDDVHKGGLGPKCADCHTETTWKEAKFDHGSTRFALTGRHTDAGCADCHRNKADYKDTPRTCVGCHRKDDDAAKGHKGQYGERCDSCHGTKAWKPSTFNHDTDTKYQLRGQHRAAKCADCHSGPLFKSKLSSDCNSCHQKDDKHKGTLGTACAACHTETNWKASPRFEHDRSAFPLLGRHADITCDSCHKSRLYKDAPTACIGCHRSDDKHAGTLGDQCAACHGERDWKTTRGRFDHDRTLFRLRNAHAAATVTCLSCHPNLRSLRKTPTDCAACHAKDDRHEGQLGRDCAGCHDDRAWKVPAFNHTRTRFPLAGRHVAAACKDCHTTPRFQDAPRECVACHRKDDTHKQAFGTQCDSCHGVRSWKTWTFDHDRSRFRLDGAHRQAACASCHTQPAPAGAAFAPLAGTCVACHAKDDTHDGGFGRVCEQCHVSDSWKKLSLRGKRSGAAAPPDPAVLAAVFGQASRLARLPAMNRPAGSPT